jgi:hypothetical protein
VFSGLTGIQNRTLPSIAPFPLRFACITKSHQDIVESDEAARFKLLRDIRRIIPTLDLEDLQLECGRAPRCGVFAPIVRLRVVGHIETVRAHARVILAPKDLCDDP